MHNLSNVMTLLDSCLSLISVVIVLLLLLLLLPWLLLLREGLVLMI